MSAFSVGCLAIGATIGLVAWHYGFKRGVRIGRDMEKGAKKVARATPLMLTPRSFTLSNEACERILREIMRDATCEEITPSPSWYSSLDDLLRGPSA